MTDIPDGLGASSAFHPGWGFVLLLVLHFKNQAPLCCSSESLTRCQQKDGRIDVQKAIAIYITKKCSSQGLWRLVKLSLPSSWGWMTAYLPCHLLPHDEKRKRTICNCMSSILSHAAAVKHTILTWVGHTSLLSSREWKAFGEEQNGGLQVRGVTMLHIHFGWERSLGSIPYFHLLLP